MKQFMLIAAVALLSGLATEASAQKKDTTTGQKIRHEAREVGADIKEGAEKVGDKTAEIATKGSSAVVDKVYRGKQGPDGQTIYIDGHSRYYWVDKGGKKIYVPAAKLKDKKD